MWRNQRVSSSVLFLSCCCDLFLLLYVNLQSTTVLGLPTPPKPSGKPEQKPLRSPAQSTRRPCRIERILVGVLCWRESTRPLHATCDSTRLCRFIYIYVYVYIYMYMCIYIKTMCIYIYACMATYRVRRRLRVTAHVWITHATHVKESCRTQSRFDKTQIWSGFDQ